MRLHLVNAIVFGFVLCLGLGLSNGVDANMLTSPVSIKIEMKKDVFKSTEAVDGKVIINSSSPISLTLTFDIKTFVDGQPRDTLFTQTSIWTGKNTYTFQEFGIPIPAQPGQWRMVIRQQNIEGPYAATADFTITP